jgi:hypothetical protein
MQSFLPRCASNFYTKRLAQNVCSWEKNEKHYEGLWTFAMDNLKTLGESFGVRFCNGYILGYLSMSFCELLQWT